jgi:hypothetical protein
MLGIEPNQSISLELDEAVQVEQLYFAPPTSHSGSDRTAADEWLREQFWRACGISHPVAKEYIYITHRRASRHIVNEKDKSISSKETTPTENIVVPIERLRKTLEQMGISEKDSRVTG